MLTVDMKDRPVVRNNHNVFKKDNAEREMLTTLKHLNKVARRKAYGRDYKKYLNVPEKSISTIVVQF